MADVRLLIQEEGRTARNLIAYNVPVGTNNTDKVTKKPPSVPRVLQNNATKRSMKTATRVRSASTGRDKKSELQARYWAFLFGNLQRAVDGIYQTCEEDENISECKEVILVLENYTRDFHNLIEWFKVKWAYESSPPPLRRTPLAWEVRKTSPCRTWNSTVMPKSTSPLQRYSPTDLICRSPIDQIITESKPVMTDNKIGRITEENVQKNAKDKKNTVSKNDSTCVKQKRNQLLREKSTLSKTVQKNVSHSLPAKMGTNTSINHRILSEVNARDVKSKSSDTRKVCNKVDFTEKDGTKVVELSNKLATHNNSENKPLPRSKDMENVKNEINAKIKDEKHQKRIIAENHNASVDTKSITTSVAMNVSKNTVTRQEKISPRAKKTNVNHENVDNKIAVKTSISAANSSRTAYSTVSHLKSSQIQQGSVAETPKFRRSKTTLSDRKAPATSKTRPGTSVIVRRRLNPSEKENPVNNSMKKDADEDINGSVEVLTKQTTSIKLKDEEDGWQTVRSRYRRGSSHNLNMATRFHRPSTATSLPALSIETPSDKNKKNCLTPDGNYKQKKKCVVGKAGKNMNNEVEKVKAESAVNDPEMKNTEQNLKITALKLSDTNSTSMIAAIFKNDAELLEKRIQQFMAAQAERERIILEEERKTEEADSKRSQQLSDEEASLKRQIMELESTEIDIDTETDETDGEMVLEIEDEPVETLSTVTDDLSLEDRYENMLEGMSWAERVDTLAQLQALVARHPGRALELHQKLSSPSRKRSLPETLRRYQAKQACAQRKRQTLLMEKSQRLRELLNKVEDVKSAKNQLIEDKRIRMEMRLKRAEENRTQHLLEIVRKAHDEDSKLKEIAFINELEAQNKRHDFMALCQEQEERLQGIHEERQRRQEEKAAKEAAAEERRRALEAERQLRIQKMKQARREREERVGKMQLEREKERQELAREKARDREERLSALHAAQLANQEELQKKIAQKQQESARRHVENIEHIRQRAVESSILRSEEVPPTLRSYPAPKQCSLCTAVIPNEVYLLSHLKGKTHIEAIKNAHDGREPSRDELQRFNIAQIRDMPNLSTDLPDSKVAKEKQKALKRRFRKMKQRLALRGQEWEDSKKNEAVQSFESANKAKFRRNIKELERLYNNHLKNAWSNATTATLERCFGEIARAFSKPCSFDQDVFRSLSGLDTLTNLLNLGLGAQNTAQTLQNKTIISLCKVYKTSVNEHRNNIETVLLSNKILAIIDLLLQRLETLTAQDDQTQVQETGNASTGNGMVVSAVTQLLSSLIPEEPFETAALQTRVQDIIGYLVAGGLIERLAQHSRALIETDFFLDQEHETPVLLAGYDLLTRLSVHLKRSAGQENANVEVNGEQSSVEMHFLSLLSTSEAAGAVGTLYASIALGSQNQKGASPTPNQTTPSASTKLLVFRGLRLLRMIAELDLPKLQKLLGAEGTSLQWRLIASHVITRLSRDPLAEKTETNGTSAPAILSELFTVLGYFALNNPENQLVLQTAGAGPGVLQQLCTLPFPFYGDPRLSHYTLPALLAATHENPEAKAVLSCELSYQLLEEYKNSEEGKLNPLVRLLKNAPSP